MFSMRNNVFNAIGHGFFMVIRCFRYFFLLSHWNSYARFHLRLILAEILQRLRLYFPKIFPPIRIPTVRNKIR